ncbi:MAG: hypothetical protein R3E40_01505 [Rhodocyclaceae bacterium]
MAVAQRFDAEGIPWQAADHRRIGGIAGEVGGVATFDEAARVVVAGGAQIRQGKVTIHLAGLSLRELRFAVS